MSCWKKSDDVIYDSNIKSCMNLMYVWAGVEGTSKKDKLDYDALLAAFVLPHLLELADSSFDAEFKLYSNSK